MLFPLGHTIPSRISLEIVCVYYLQWDPTIFSGGALYLVEDTIRSRGRGSILCLVGILLYLVVLGVLKGALERVGKLNPLMYVGILPNIRSFTML